jgi:hypothetical protein
VLSHVSLQVGFRHQANASMSQTQVTEPAELAITAQQVAAPKEQLELQRERSRQLETQLAKWQAWHEGAPAAAAAAAAAAATSSAKKRKHTTEQDQRSRVSVSKQLLEQLPEALAADMLVNMSEF